MAFPKALGNDGGTIWKEPGFLNDSKEQGAASGNHDLSQSPKEQDVGGLWRGKVQRLPLGAQCLISIYPTLGKVQPHLHPVQNKGRAQDPVPVVWHQQS